MIRKNRTAKSLTGIFCLPTSSKFHCSDRERSGAYATDQIAYVLSATQSIEDGGYPAQVVLTSAEGDLELSLGDEVPTQHAEVRKNLPPRKVTGIVMSDGSTFGEVPVKGIGLPHWEYIPANDDGSASMEAISLTTARLSANRTAREAAKETARTAKKPAAATTQAA